jgi:hypothetical protein
MGERGQERSREGGELWKTRYACESAVPTTGVGVVLTKEEFPHDGQWKGR